MHGGMRAKTEQKTERKKKRNPERASEICPKLFKYINESAVSALKMSQAIREETFPE